MAAEPHETDPASASTRFWIAFATAVLPLLVFLSIPRATQNGPALIGVLLLSPVVGWLLVTLFRSDAKRSSVIDVALAVWAVLFISAPLVFVVAPAVPFLAFVAAFWGTQWRGRYRGAALLLVGVLAGLYWSWATIAP